MVDKPRFDRRHPANPSNPRPGLMTNTQAAKLAALAAIYTLSPAFTLVGNQLGVADPFPITNLRLGTHPTYGSNYSAIWDTRLSADYRYLMDGSGGNTFVNALTGGSVLLRVANADKVGVSNVYMYSNVPQVIGGNAQSSTQMLEVLGQIEAQYPANRAIKWSVIHNGSNAHMETAGAGNTYLNWFSGLGTFVIGVPVLVQSSGGVLQTFTSGRLSATGGTGASANLFINDAWTYRAATPTTGVIYLNNAQTRYLFFDGTQYVMPNSNLLLNGVVVSSSQDYKQNIRDMMPDALGTLMKLRPRRFNFTSTPDRDEQGFVYEELPADLSWLQVQAKGANDEDFKALNYNGIFVLTTKAVQELAVVVNNLRQRIVALEAKVA